MAKVWSKLLQTRRAVGSIIFHAAIALVGCTIVGSLVDAITQITSSEVVAEIVIAIAVISVAIQISHATVVVAAVVVLDVAAIVLSTAVVISTAIMAAVSALTVI